MTIVAIDYGKRRLGIAAGDLSTKVAHPIEVIERRSLKHDLIALRTRLNQLRATLVVVGLPLNMDGTVGPAALAAQRFAQVVHEATGLEVLLYDERLSTFEARERLKTPSRRSRRAVVDALAAAVILESWFEGTRVAGGSPGGEVTFRK